MLSPRRWPRSRAVAVEAKICGLTRPEDAALAVRLGADYLGAVFAPSPRQVDWRVARELAAAGEGVPLLGVFVREPADDILRLRDRARLAGAQLHGDYDVATRERLGREGLRVWSVVRLAAEADLDALAGAVAAAELVLVEPRVPGAEGGTGTTLPLELAQAARERLDGARMALAGGLGPATVGRAIALVRPDVVDVSSGVEMAPGRKDPALVEQFLEVVRDGRPRP